MGLTFLLEREKGIGVATAQSINRLNWIAQNTPEGVIYKNRWNHQFSVDLPSEPKGGILADEVIIITIYKILDGSWENYHNDCISFNLT